MTPFLLGYLAVHEGRHCNPFFLGDAPGYDTARKRLSCARPASQSETPQGVAARSIPGASSPFKAQFNRGRKYN